MVPCPFRLQGGGVALPEIPNAHKDTAVLPCDGHDTVSPGAVTRRHPAVGGTGALSDLTGAVRKLAHGKTVPDRQRFADFLKQLPGISFPVHAFPFQLFPDHVIPGPGNPGLKENDRFMEAETVHLHLHVMVVVFPVQRSPYPETHALHPVPVFLAVKDKGVGHRDHLRIPQGQANLKAHDIFVCTQNTPENQFQGYGPRLLDFDFIHPGPAFDDPDAGGFIVSVTPLQQENRTQGGDPGYAMEADILKQRIRSRTRDKGREPACAYGNALRGLNCLNRFRFCRVLAPWQNRHFPAGLPAVHGMPDPFDGPVRPDGRRS